MSPDRLHIDVVRVTSLAESGTLNVVESVGASKLDEHLRTDFGESVPKEERAKRVSSKLLDAMARLSTDPEYSIYAELDPVQFLPHWLKLTEPVIAQARTAGGYVHRELTTRENNTVAAQQPLSPDFQYVYSVCDLSSFVVAAELDIEHPSVLAKQTAERTDEPMSREKIERIVTLDFFASHPLVPAPQRRRVKEVLRFGEQFISNTHAFQPRLVHALELINGAD